MVRLTLCALLLLAASAAAQRYLPQCTGNPVHHGVCKLRHPLPDECQSDYDCGRGSTCCRGPCNNRCTLPLCYGYTGNCHLQQYRRQDECYSSSDCGYKTCCYGNCNNECRG